MGRLNEVGVDARRDRPGAAVLGESRDVTAERVAQLGQLTEHDADGPAMTPVGPGTVAALMAGRSDAPNDARIAGDRELSQRVLDSMGILP